MMTDRPAIKSLEWRHFDVAHEYGRGAYDANAGFGITYEVLDCRDTVRDFPYYCPKVSNQFLTLEEAQAAAQSDFEARIRSCLLDKPEAVEVAQPEFGYMRIVEVFDRNETAGAFLSEDGEGGFAAGVSRMADEIDRLRRELEEARKALRQMRCPRPCNHQPEDLDAGDCIDAGECGCIDSRFLSTLRAEPTP